MFFHQMSPFKKDCQTITQDVFKVKYLHFSYEFLSQTQRKPTKQWVYQNHNIMGDCGISPKSHGFHHFSKFYHLRGSKAQRSPQLQMQILNSSQPIGSYLRQMLTSVQ